MIRLEIGFSKKKFLQEIKLKVALFSIFIVIASTFIVPSFAQYYYPSQPPPPPLPPPDFSISVAPSNLAIQQGVSGSYVITVTPLNGFNSQVTLSISGNPSSVKASFSPNPINPSQGNHDTTLTITASSSSNANTYDLTVTAISGSLTHTTTMTLTIAASEA